MLHATEFQSPEVESIVQRLENALGELCQSPSVLKRLFSMAHLASKQAEIDNLSEIKLILAIRQALIKKDIPEKVANAITVIYGAFYFMDEADEFPDFNHLKQAEDWLHNSEIWLKNSASESAALKLLQGWLLEKPLEEAILESETVKKTILKTGEIETVELPILQREWVLKAWVAIQKLTASLEFNELNTLTPARYVEAVSKCWSETKVPSTFFAMTATVLAFQNSSFSKNKKVFKADELEKIFDLAFNALSKDSVCALNTHASSVLTGIRHSELKAYTQYSKSFLERYQQQAIHFVAAQRKALAAEFEEQQTHLKSYRSELGEAVQSMTIAYQAYQAEHKEIEQRREALQQAESEKRHAKRRKRIKILKTVIGVVVGAFVAPIAAPMLSISSTVGAAAAKGAIFGGISSTVAGDNPLKGTLQGGLLAGVGQWVSHASGAFTKLESLKKTASIVATTGLSTKINGGNILKNIGVAIIANGITDKVLPIHQNSTTIGEQLLETDIIEDAKEIAYRAFTAGGISSLLNGGNVDQNLIAAGMGCVEGVASMVGESISSDIITAKAKSSKKQKQLSIDKQSKKKMISKKNEALPVVDNNHGTKNLKVASGIVVGGVMSVINQVGNVISFLSDAGTVADGLEEPFQRDKAFQEAFTRNERRITGVVETIQNPLETGRQIAASFRHRLLSAEAEYHKGNEFIAGIELGELGGDIGLTVLGGVSGAKVLLAGKQLRSPLVFDFAPGQYNMGLPLDRFRLQNPILNKTISEAQKGSGIPRATSSSDALRLKAELAFKQEGILNHHGKLTEKALKNIENPRRQLTKGETLKNPEVIQALTKEGHHLMDWGKYTTEAITLSTQQKVQIHFYYNRVTKEVNYSHGDFKINESILPFAKNPTKEGVKNANSM